MKAKIDKFLKEILPSLTKEEADNIYDIIKWDDETKSAFCFAKLMFEEMNADE